MQATIIGKREVNFTSKDGKQVNYTELHLICKDKHVFGNKCMIVNTSLNEAQELAIPGEYQLYYEPTSSGKARLATIQSVK